MMLKIMVVLLLLNIECMLMMVILLLQLSSTSDQLQIYTTFLITKYCLNSLLGINTDSELQLLMKLVNQLQVMKLESLLQVYLINLTHLK